MRLAQYTASKSSEYLATGFPGTVGGTVVIAVANLLAMPMAQPMEPQRFVPSRITYATPASLDDTQQSLMVRVGLLREGVSTLISEGAKAAIGNAGLKRLENFFNLQAGWDGGESQPINLKSVEVFSNFFAETGLRPEGLGLFMSAQGNVVANWLGRDGQLVELEFLPSGIEYFIERSGEEGVVPKGDIGFTKLLNRVLEPV